MRLIFIAFFLQICYYAYMNIQEQPICAGEFICGLILGLLIMKIWLNIKNNKIDIGEVCALPEKRPAFPHFAGEREAAPVKENLVHAYLIVSDSVEEREQMALSLAQKMLCEDERERPCGHCRHCRKVLAGIHPDLIFVERERDGKVMTLVLQPIKGMKLAAVDVKATLAYNRGEVRNLDVVPGSEIDLNGSKYRITDITPVGKGAKVTLESVLSGKKRTLEALER